jgi:hypothetical protein
MSVLYQRATGEEKNEGSENERRIKDPGFAPQPSPDNIFFMIFFPTGTMSTACGLSLAQLVGAR